jgi:AcrR family transcriptional regulator
MPDPTSSSHDATDRAILDAACKLFAEKGFHSCDVDAVAAAAGVGKGTVYRRFDDKAGLFRATVDHAVRGLSAAVDAIPETADLLADIEGSVTAYFTYFRAHPGLVELLIHERAVFPGAGSAYFRHADAHQERWRVRLRQGVADGVLRPVDPETIIRLIGDALFGAMFTAWVGGPGYDPAEQARRITDLIAERPRALREEEP